MEEDIKEEPIGKGGKETRKSKGGDRKQIMSGTKEEEGDGEGS